MYAEILPAEHRVLRLDCDTFVQKDISELFDMDLEDNYTAMVEEPVRSVFPFSYFNAGVCLMDLDKFRQSGIIPKMVKMANSMILTALDQDAINVFCQGEIKKIPPVWNDAGHITEYTEDPYIIHYAGTRKAMMQKDFDLYRNAEWRIKK